MQMQHFRNSWIATKNIWNTSAIFRGYQLKCFTRFKNSNIENIYDLTNFITKDNGGKETRVIRNLIQDKKYYHLRKTVNYSKSDSSLTKTYTKGSKTFNISYKKRMDWEIFLIYMEQSMRRTKSLQIFERLSFTSFISSIPEYFTSYTAHF